MKFDVTAILEALVTLCSAIVTAVLLPLIREKLSAQKRAQLADWVKIAVAAAEQLFGSGSGQRKKDYVLSFLLEKGLVCNADEVTALLESEVYRLTHPEADV